MFFYSILWSVAFVASMMLIMHGTVRRSETRYEAKLDKLEKKFMAEITETSEMEKEN